MVTKELFNLILVFSCICHLCVQHGKKAKSLLILLNDFNELIRKRCSLSSFLIEADSLKSYNIYVSLKAVGKTTETPEIRGD